MQLKHQLSLEAENDAFESYSWYESNKVGLGEKFLESLDLALNAISSSPFAYKVFFKKKVRAYHLTDFPFTVLYLVESNEIKVIAIFHTSRNPRQWKKRV